MSYQTYITDAIVCGTYRRNTADASYQLLTAESGVLYASARSVREERSRQRYALQDFARVRISLVRGKGGWRIGSVEALENFYHQATEQSSRRAVVAIVKLVRRFVNAEGALPSVFPVTCAVLRRVVAEPSAAAWLTDRYELWLLWTLGYVPRTVSVEQWCPAEIAAWEPVDATTATEITHAITAATAASQL